MLGSESSFFGPSTSENEIEWHASVASRRCYLSWKIHATPLELLEKDRFFYPLRQFIVRDEIADVFSKCPFVRFPI